MGRAVQFGDFEAVFKLIIYPTGTECLSRFSVVIFRWVISSVSHGLFFVSLVGPACRLCNLVRPFIQYISSRIDDRFKVGIRSYPTNTCYIIHFFPALYPT